MKTHEEGYALGWADAIYAYESKQRKQMSTVDDLMALAEEWAVCEFSPTTRGTYGALKARLRSALESALKSEYERGRRQGITDVHDKLRVEHEQAAEPPMPMGWLESPHGAFRANPLVRVSMPPETLAWQIPLYFSPPKREPLPEREIKDICHMNGWDDSYQSMRFARAIERAHGIGDE